MLNLVNLPDVVLETILSNLSYDEIARNRIVCKRFDRVCKKLLNRGFYLMEKYHAQCLKSVKSQLPRRESERRSHPLSRHCDILTAIETRISMLSMTFIKYVDLNLCCFIPGKVIDEILRVLRLIKVDKSNPKAPPRGHEILQELRDISSMAMEHFDEKILPDLKHSMCSSSMSSVASYDLPLVSTCHAVSSLPLPFSSSLPLSNYTQEKLTTTFKRIYSRTRKNKQSTQTIKKQMNKLKLRLRRQILTSHMQGIKLNEQSKKLREQGAQIADMKKHFEEWEQKIGDLTAELSRAREEAQNPDSIDNCKRKRIIESDELAGNLSTDLQAKKRKLIVERTPSSDAKDIKFKKFMSDLLAGGSMDSP